MNSFLSTIQSKPQGPQNTNSSFDSGLGEKEAPPPPPPVDLKFEKMSRDGMVNIKFNQDLKIPDFLKKDTERGRALLELSDIDV
jgi:hypothetical protein